MMPMTANGAGPPLTADQLLHLLVQAINRPRYVLDPYGNQLDLNNFVQAPGRYIGDFTLTANQISPNQNITLQGHEAYFAVLRLFNSSTNPYRVKLYSSIAGNILTFPSAASPGLSDQARSDLLYGSLGGNPSVLPAFWLIPGAGLIQHDFTEIAGLPNTIHVEYEGLRLYPLSA
jgi:hypothetical protein